MNFLLIEILKLSNLKLPPKTTIKVISVQMKNLGKVKKKRLYTKE